MKKKIFLLLNIFLLFFNIKVMALENNVEVHFIDSGQSDCILIKGDKNNYLIDTGSYMESGKIIRYLKDNHINKIDDIIITHFHNDHFGGIYSIASNIKVNRVLLPYEKNNICYSIFEKMLENKIDVKYLNSNYEISTDKIKLKAYTNSVISKNENNNSVIIYGLIDDIKYVFCGDAEKEEEDELINFKPIKDSYIIKVPHHGLNTSSTEKFLDMVNAKIAVITCDGAESPSKYVINRLSESEYLILRTDKRGNIVIKNNKINHKNQLNIKVEK